MTDEPTNMTELHAAHTHAPSEVRSHPYEDVTIRDHVIECACMNEITLEHIRMGYHPMCMRTIQIVLTRMVKNP